MPEYDSRDLPFPLSGIRQQTFPQDLQSRRHSKAVCMNEFVATFRSVTSIPSVPQSHTSIFKLRPAATSIIKLPIFRVPSTRFRETFTPLPIHQPLHWFQNQSSHHVARAISPAPQRSRHLHASRAAPPAPPSSPPFQSPKRNSPSRIPPSLHP